MESLGVIASHSRPRVSDDNPSTESLFWTVRYCPEYPKKPFASLEAARQWVAYFVAWYSDVQATSLLRLTTRAVTQPFWPAAARSTSELTVAIRSAGPAIRGSGSRPPPCGGTRSKNLTPRRLTRISRRLSSAVYFDIYRRFRLATSLGSLIRHCDTVPGKSDTTKQASLRQGERLSPEPEGSRHCDIYPPSPASAVPPSGGGPPSGRGRPSLAQACNSAPQVA